MSALDQLSALQTSLRRAAGRVWRDMSDADACGLFLNEESITESVLLFLSRRHQTRELFIRPYNKPKEKGTGTDWEWCFAWRNRSITMRVQAKRLCKPQHGVRASPAYNALAAKSQINTLIQMAGKSHPLYVFYNDAQHGGHVLSNRPLRSTCCSSFRGLSVWGCMIARAQDVRSTGSRKMKDLLPPSNPWHCLLCPQINRRQESALSWSSVSARYRRRKSQFDARASQQ
jgi:hypothetical protein